MSVKRKTILIVEDDARLREILYRVLSSQGYELLIAKDGNEAEQILADRKEPVDLMLVDLVLPTSSGAEVAQAAKGSHPSCRVVYMSGYLDLDPKKFPEISNESFLAKPFSITALSEKIKDSLEDPEGKKPKN